jgi:hypothetical protein
LRNEVPGEVEIQKVLIDFEEKPYMLFEHVKYWLGQILGSPLHLKCKGIRSMECSGTRLFGQVLEDALKRGKSWQEIVSERLWEER